MAAAAPSITRSRGGRTALAEREIRYGSTQNDGEVREIRRRGT